MHLRASFFYTKMLSIFETLAASSSAAVALLCSSPPTAPLTFKLTREGYGFYWF